MKDNLLKSTFPLIFLSFFFLSLTFIPAQDKKTIQGVVLSVDHKYISGASVLKGGSKKGTLTNSKGEFKIVVKSGTEYLRIIHPEYNEQKIFLNSGLTYKIELIKKSKRDLAHIIEEDKRLSYSTDDRSPSAPSVFSGRKESLKSYAKVKSTSADYKMKTMESSEPAAVVESAFVEGEAKKRVVSEEKVSKSRAGQLTAGEWNDLHNWEDWNNLIKEEDYKEMAKYWNINPSDRVSVFVSNQFELPIADCEVILKSNDKIIWSSKTDNAGKAELWMSNDSKNLELSVKSKLNSFQTKDFKKFKEGINTVQFTEECNTSLKADIMFVVDATGSMGDEIEFLKTELNDVIDNVESKRSQVSFRWGSVFYRDHTDNYLTLQSPLDKDKNTITEFIQAQGAGGGGDYPEAVNAGLEEALMQSWNTEAIARIIFLVLDAPPHHDPSVMKELESQIEFASAMGIKIIPITASGINRQTEYLMKFMSIMTNGTYVFLTDHSGIGNAHLDPITKDYKVEKLNDLLIRLIQNYSDPGTCNYQAENNEIFRSIEIFPNPTLDYVQLKVPEGVKELTLSTNTGQVLHREKISENCDVTLDLTAYIDGLYFVNFHTQDKIFTSKVVKNTKA